MKKVRLKSDLDETLKAQGWSGSLGLKSGNVYECVGEINNKNDKYLSILVNNPVGVDIGNNTGLFGVMVILAEFFEELQQ